MNGSDAAPIGNETTKADVRKLKAHLRDLSAAVSGFLVALDAEMVRPSDNARGARIAKLCNALDLANDRVRYFALDVDYRTDKKESRRA